MKFGKWIFGNRSEDVSHQERLMRPLFGVGLAGVLIGVIASIFTGENIENIIGMGIFFFILAGVIFYSIYFRKIQFGACAIGCLIVYLALPINFMTGGGVYGGSSVWFIFGVVYICLIVEGIMRYVLLISCLGICCACYGIAYFYPAVVVGRETEKLIYLDSFSTVIIVSALISVMVIFQNKIFKEENEVAEEQKKEIEELNKAQNNFFSSMSHEIRTPINTIIGLNEMILREDVSDEVAEDAKNIQNASKMLLSLINDILDMSKIESGKMDIVPVSYHMGDMLSDIVNMIWIRAKEKGLSFHIDVDQTMPVQFFGDEVRIKQVLVNILNNAVKYTEEGSVTLSIHCEKAENGVAQVIYSITDTGIGIKKENIPHLFSAFKRVDEENNRYIEGTGLGLSIVKQLVNLMGGDIAVNSVYTKGSTFVISLPQTVLDETEIGDLNLETRHAMNERKHYKQSFEAPKAKVLVVDDNETNLLVAEKLLRDTKIQIDKAASGTECLKKTQQTSYHMIFMDHLMPEMDGIECFHNIRNQTGGLNHETPVVVLTANAGSNNQELYRREGFDGYLLKPVTGNQLEMELLKNLPRELLIKIGDEDSIGIIESAVHSQNKKIPIMITADSTCDLPKALLEKHNIGIMPHLIHMENGEFLDGVEADTDGILSYLRDKSRVLKSDAQPLEAYENFFAEQLTKAHLVIHVCLPKTLSRSYRHSREAEKVFDNVNVVNSKHLSSGMGLLVLRAAELAEQGLSLENIVKELQHTKEQVNTSFVVDTTEYLMRNGRISERVNTMCSTLMLHPVLQMKKGDLKVRTIYMGTRQYIWKKYIKSTLKNVKEIDTSILFITHVGLSKKELDSIAEQVKQKVVFKKVIYQQASSAISINCGAGTFGLIYYSK